MHFRSITLFLSIITSSVITSPVQEDQLQFKSTTINKPSSNSFTNSLFACPTTWKIRCVKDKKWPSGIVGDIGIKPFCFSGFRCNQCDFEGNTIECNETFVEECDGKCTAYAPIPF